MYGISFEISFINKAPQTIPIQTRIIFVNPALTSIAGKISPVIAAYSIIPAENAVSKSFSFSGNFFTVNPTKLPKNDVEQIITEVIINAFIFSPR